VKVPRISSLLTDTKLILYTQIVNAALALVFTLAVARYGVASEFGFCAITIFILSVFLDIIDFGSCSKYSRELASKKISERQYFAIMNRKSLILLAWMPMVLLFVIYANRDIKSGVLFALYPVFWNRQNYLQQYLVTKGFIHSSLGLQLADRLSWLCVLPLVILNFSYIHVYMIPILLGLVLHNVMGTVVVKRNNVALSDFLALRTSRVSDTRHFGMLSVMSDFANMDIAVVARYADSAGAGTYTLSQRFRTPIVMVFQSIVTQLKPMTAAREGSRIKRLFRSELPRLILGVVALLVGAILSRLYADDIFGESYEQIDVILPLGILIGVPSGAVAICSAFLASAGYERRVSNLTTAWVLLMLCALAFFTSKFGVLGAIITMFFLYTALAGVLLLISARVWNKEFR